MRYLLALFLFVFAACACMSPAKTKPDVVRDVYNSVTMLEYNFVDLLDQEGGVTASGFAIDNDHIITARSFLYFGFANWFSCEKRRTQNV